MEVFKRFTRSKPDRWPDFESNLPWYDREDALETLNKRANQEQISEVNYDLLSKWIRDGYVIIPGMIDDNKIDQMITDVENVWNSATPFPDLQIEEVRRKLGDKPGMAHAQLLQIPAEERSRMQQHERWRLHGFYRFSAATRSIYENPDVKALCSLIFGVEALPRYSINFIYGSRQELHQDTAVFHVSPPNHLIGAWLACEDVSPEAGPLVYYPGSQKTPLFSKFDNYPQTNLRTCNFFNTHRYNSQLKKAACKFTRHEFLAKKGDVLLWNGLLIHGGDDIKTPGLTRKSFVTHFIPEGMDRSMEVQGPFNWG